MDITYDAIYIDVGQEDGEEIKLSLGDMKKKLNTENIFPIYINYLNKEGFNLIIYIKEIKKLDFNKIATLVSRKPIFGPAIIIDKNNPFNKKSLQQVLNFSKIIPKVEKNISPPYINLIRWEENLDEKTKSLLLPISLSEQIKICYNKVEEIRKYIEKKLKYKEDINTKLSKYTKKIKIQKNHQGKNNINYVGFNKDGAIIYLEKKGIELANINYYRKTNDEYLIIWNWLVSAEILEKLPENLKLLNKRSSFFITYEMQIYLSLICENIIGEEFINFEQITCERDNFSDLLVNIECDDKPKNYEKFIAITEVCEKNIPIDISSINLNELDINDKLIVERIKYGECNCCYLANIDKKFKKCGSCQEVIYCSVQCQKKDWITHKNNCILKK